MPAFKLTANHIKPDFTLKAPFNQGKVLILFQRPGCPHCDHFKPTFLQAADMIPDVTFAVVDTSQEQKLMQMLEKPDSPYDIQGVPTVLSHYNGKFFSKFGGDRTIENIQKYSAGIGKAPITFMRQ
jgi:thiol-disulfide isomerase/thioredoxin